MDGKAGVVVVVVVVLASREGFMQIELKTSMRSVFNSYVYVLYIATLSHSLNT
jgi:hypothetical protein